MSDHAAKIDGGCAKVWEKVSIFMAQNTIPECPTTSVTVLEQNDYYAYGESVTDGSSRGSVPSSVSGVGSILTYIFPLVNREGFYFCL